MSAPAPQAGQPAWRVDDGGWLDAARRCPSPNADPRPQGTAVDLLVAHNIDLAPRVPGLAPGVTVRFHGEYEWNERGGVIHWTHRAPREDHAHGWIEYRGRRYQ